MRALRILLAALSDVLRQKIPAADEREKSENDYHRDVVVALQELKAEVERQRTEANQRRRSPTLAIVFAGCALIVNAITMGAVIHYAYVANQQLIESRRQTAEVARSNEFAHRAWVYARDLRLTKPYDRRLFGDWGMNVVVNNAGEPPAMTRTYVIHLDPQPPPPSPEKCPDVERIGESASGGTLRQALTYIVEPKRPEKPGTLVFQRRDLSDIIGAALRRPSNGGYRLTVYGLIDYLDPFETMRRSTFCFFLLPHINEANAIIADPPKTTAFAQCEFCNSLK